MRQGASAAREAVASPSGSVPVALTSLVGRGAKVDEAIRLLNDHRMVTITGTGGVGKTRLAMAVGRAIVADFRDGVFWIDLGAVTDQSILMEVVVAALDVPQTADQDLPAHIVTNLARCSTLVILDNCEQLADECARLAGALLTGCPDVRLLATSRELLGLPGEAVVRLEGLSCAHGSAAMQLFEARATALVPGFLLSDEDAPVVEELCAALDGLPLAIELAAARVGILPAREIAERLRDDPRLLRNPSRIASGRHVTLEATLEWSYRLLTPTEQALFRRLSVFSGTFSLPAAEEVAFRAGIAHAQFLQLLGWLVDKSLVHVAERGPEPRYRVLETVRYFAYEHLARMFETSSAHEAHLGHFLGLARQASAGLDGPEQLRWLERLELELDNLRSALSWASRCDAESLGQLVGALWPFWYRRGLYGEAREWVERAFTLLGEMRPATQAETLTGAGVLAFLQCDYALAADRLSSARALYHAEGDSAGLATVLQRLGSVARERGEYARARELHRESRALFEALGDLAGVAASDDFLGFAAWLEGSFDEAEQMSGQALDFFLRSGVPQETAAAYVNLGAAAYHRGDVAGATTLCTRARALSSAINYLEGLAWSLHFLGMLGMARHESSARELARDQLAEALSIHLRLGDRWRVASLLEAIATSCVLPDDPAGAARIFGASDALRRRIGAPVPPVELGPLDEARSGARAVLGASHWDVEWGAGARSSLEQAVAWAHKSLDVLAGPASGRTREGRPAVLPAPKELRAANVPSVAAPEAAAVGSLTSRELDILRLVMRGRTNREIARELFISPGTAGVHVSNILRKLGLSSRVQAATLAQRAGLGDGEGDADAGFVVARR